MPSNHRTHLAGNSIDYRLESWPLIIFDSLGHFYSNIFQYSSNVSIVQAKCLNRDFFRPTQSLPTLTKLRLSADMILIHINWSCFEKLLLIHYGLIWQFRIFWKYLQNVILISHISSVNKLDNVSVILYICSEIWKILTCIMYRYVCYHGYLK